MNAIEKAKEFAIKAHGEQKRKYTGEPYVNHCFAVAELVASHCEDNDTIIAAILHDTVEDTEVTIDEIRSEFGDRVAKFVGEVTDVSKPTDGNRKRRKEIDREHLAKASSNGMTIKLADLINNTETIVKYDENFAKVYMREKNELLKVLVYGNEKLYWKARKLVTDYFNARGEFPSA